METNRKIRVYGMLAAIVLLSAASVGAARGQQKSAMVFDRDTWDFGRIRELDGPVSHTFTFTNTSNKPMVIERVSVSCGCTTPTYSKKPVMAGAKGEITVTYDPAGRPGVFMKEIYILSGGGANRNIIYIKGDVEGRPLSVEEKYPFEMAGGVRLDRLRLDFSTVQQGHPVSASIGYANTSQSALPLAVRVTPADTELTHNAPKSICGGCKGEITFTYSPAKGQSYGRKIYRVHPVVDGKEPKFPVSAFAIAVDDFSGVNAATAPKVEISPSYHDFGSVAKGKKLSKEFTIKNTGKSDLYLRRVEIYPPVEADITGGLKIAPGKSEAITLTLDTSKTEGGFFTGSTLMVFNDPATPYRGIQISARVK